MCTLLGLALLTVATSAGAQQQAKPGKDRAQAASPPANAAPVEEAASFELLAQKAAAAMDLGTVLGPFLQKCDGEKRPLDRIRCEATRAYLRQALPAQRYRVVVSDPAAIEVSEYDARVKGYTLTLAGCMACSEPVAAGASGERRFVTTRVPAKDAASLAAAVEIARNNLTFESIPEAKTWLKAVRPQLRAEFVFQPADAEWTSSIGKGYAFKLLGWRAFDRCTGEVLVSRPPSTGQGGKAVEEQGCPKAGDRQQVEAAETKPDPGEGLPQVLGKDHIGKAMGRIKGQIYACFQQFEVPGNANLTFEVASNGMVQSVKLHGAFDGTPTGECILDAAKGARFSKFREGKQKFDYPFFLR